MQPLFRPFERLKFDEATCFLSGKPSDELVPVFPEWLMERYQLGERPMKMLDEHVITYNDIRYPVSKEVKESISLLDEDIRTAFDQGYDAVKELDELQLFQWITKLVYGIIHHEMRSGMRQQRALGEDFILSQSLMHKFGNLHLMLQSLIRPVEFEGVLPWTIRVFPVNNAPDTFIYRDEMNTLVFSVRMNNFGIVACLQENGESAFYHREVLEVVAGKVLHPVQFEEISARFFYSAYLFNRLPEYSLLNTGDTLFIEAMPLRLSSKPLFDMWQNKTYGQVLENFWKPWGFLLFEIIKDPENPMSFIGKNASVAGLAN